MRIENRTYYIANDGSEWKTEEEALLRDSMFSRVENIMASLKPVPKDGNFEGYVQQYPSTIEEVKRRLLLVVLDSSWLAKDIRSCMAEKGWSQEEFTRNVHAAWFCRMLDGTRCPLSNAYYRLYRIDDQGREWNQPYFALNPGKGVQECIG